MFQEVTIMFLSKKINLYPNYTQCCQGTKKKTCSSHCCLRLDHLQSKIPTGFISKLYSLLLGRMVLKNFNFVTKWRMCKVNVHFSL